MTDLNGRFHHRSNVYVAGPALFPASARPIRRSRRSRSRVARPTRSSTRSFSCSLDSVASATDRSPDGRWRDLEDSSNWAGTSLSPLAASACCGSRKRSSTISCFTWNGARRTSPTIPVCSFASRRWGARIPPTTGSSPSTRATRSRSTTAGSIPMRARATTRYIKRARSTASRRRRISHRSQSDNGMRSTSRLADRRFASG